MGRGAKGRPEGPKGAQGRRARAEGVGRGLVLRGKKGFGGRQAHYENFFRRHKLTRVSVFPGGERCEKHADEHDMRLANSGSS